MNYEILFGDGTLKDIANLKKNNPSAYKKVDKILNELIDHPRTGIRHPEPLRGGNNITWSRHFTKKDRIIYDIYDDKVLVTIIQVGGHYGDK